jgi:hypothetical protein
MEVQVLKQIWKSAEQLGGRAGNRAKGTVEGVTQAWARREMNMKRGFLPFIPVFMSYKIQDIQACQI